jgi:hypothetical protein
MTITDVELTDVFSAIDLDWPIAQAFGWKFCILNHIEHYQNTGMVEEQYRDRQNQTP